MIRYENLKLGDKMNYWQFKFDMKNGVWKEFATITAGETFDQSITAYKKMQGCKGDIVFYYQTNEKIGKGIHFITEIISEPYKEEYNTGYAIKLKIIKRLDNYIDYKNKFFDLHQYYNTEDIRERTQGKEIIKDEFNPKKLYDYLMRDTKNIPLKENIIDNSLIDKAKKIKQTYIDNGYLFNAFHNLNLIKGEVKHLAFIGNLLNPYGNHFKGDLFLNYFIESLQGYNDLKDNTYLSNFTKNNPTIIVEKIVKDTNDKYIGRIDLWLESDDFIIAIEGKIEAVDNKGQLKKYNEYLRNQDKKYLLLYLTLRKDEEPENIKREELSNFHLLNFEQDILEFIDNSIEDENITDNIRNTLLDYKDALLKYMYNYHLSFKYSRELILYITKTQDIFKKFQDIKEHYYQNKNKLKHTIYEDIAENFEYAKAYIERLFLSELKDSRVNDNTIVKSDLSLDDDISKDLYIITKARMARLQPKINDKKPEENNLGDIIISFYDCDYEEDEDEGENEDIREYFNFSYINNCIGLMYNIVNEDEDSFSLYCVFGDKILKIDNEVFKSDNISKLLDKNYRNKLIKKVLE